MLRLCFFILAVCVTTILPAGAAGPIRVDGITEPFMDVQLGFADAGIIRQQFFKEGDTVKVKLIGLDQKTGKFKLSRKVLMAKPEGAN